MFVCSLGGVPHRESPLPPPKKTTLSKNTLLVPVDNSSNPYGHGMALSSRHRLK